VGEARWAFGIVGDVHSTIRYASVHARLRSTGSVCIGWILNAEVLVHAALTPNIAADVQRAWVHISKLLVTPSFTIGLLRPADSILYCIRHWRFAVGKAYFLARLKVTAASKAPRIVVHVFDVLRSEIIRVGKGPAVIIMLDVVRKTRAIGLLLWADYRRV
jgi:hypothetical protein